jgi:hypothetical protein
MSIFDIVTRAQALTVQLRPIDADRATSPQACWQLRASVTIAYVKLRIKALRAAGGNVELTRQDRQRSDAGLSARVRSPDEDLAITHTWGGRHEETMPMMR